MSYEDVDPLGQRDRRNRLLISTSVAIVASALMWGLLASEFLQRWIWDGWAFYATRRQARWLEDGLEVTAVLIVVLSFVVTWVLHRRHGERRWLASLFPQAQIHRERRRASAATAS